MSFASLRKIVRSARKGLCSTCSKTRYPQLEAAGAGHVGCLIYTLETLGTLITDEHDVTAMHVAARKGHISVLIYLVENKLVSDIPRAKNGATPAHDAAGSGNLECLQYILTQTIASPNDVDINNATPLHWAVQAGHLKIIKWLVIESNAAVDTSAKNGMTLLHLAASKNHFDVTRWLTLYLYKNHSKPRRLINSKDRNGATPIYHAARPGHVKVIQWLAEKGGDPTIFTTQGFAPIHAAATAGQLEAVKYLFQFGSATAPGGLRTTEGASTMHFAAAEGHVKIVEWLLQEKKCTGNERDYYQSTPLHDAAENGQIKVIEVMSEHGANCTLADVEGNTAKDLAVKNGQTKAARYLSVLMKQRASKGKNGSMVGGIDRTRGLSRTKHSNAEMIDNYRNAPPHQIPVSVFDDDIDPYEHDSEDGDDMSEEDEWTTLRDLMGDREIEELGGSPLVSSSQKNKLTEAETKRRKLEEDIRREKEERLKKRQELMMRENEYEQEIRERILQEERQSTREKAAAEKAYEPVEKDKKKRLSGPAAPKSSGNFHGPPQTPRRITLPGSVSSHELSRGLVEKRTENYEKMPGSKAEKKKSKWWSRKSNNSSSKKLKTSQSWDSSMSSSVSPYKGDEDINKSLEIEDSIPEPPPVPTVEYLLGKRPVNLRKKLNQTLKDQLKERAAHLKRFKEEGEAVAKDSDEQYDSDSHSSVGSSRGSSKGERKHHHKKGSKHKRKKKGEDDEGDVDWNYNKLSAPHSSPSSTRRDHKSSGSPNRTRKPLVRKLTPMPSMVPKSDIKLPSAVQLQLNFDAFDEINRSLEQAILSTSPSSTSPLNSPSSHSSPSSSLETSPLHVPHTSTVTTRANESAHFHPHAPPASPTTPSSGMGRSKRGGPKLQPHLQNKQAIQQISTHPTARQSQKGFAASTLIPKMANSHNKMRLGNLPNNLPHVPQLSRQHGRVDDELDMSIDDIELQLNEMKTRLVNSAKSMLHSGVIRPPSPEPRHSTSEEEESESETDESSEYSSGSDDTSTSDTDDTSDSSDEELHEIKKPITPRRFIMAKNPVRGLGESTDRQSGGFNRLRMLSRYPKLFRKRIITLDTITEKAEEAVFEFDTSQDRAVIFHRIQVERKYMKAWRQYIVIMKAAYRKAEKIAQRKRRDHLAKVFYAWIQVRNIGAVDKAEEDRAKRFYQKQLKRRLFRAWLNLKEGVNFSMARSASLQLIDAEQKYLHWLNSQLEPGIGKTVDNISSSLSDGTLIIHAISYASGKKPPKFNQQPRVRLHRQDNWKTAHSYMKSVGINVKGVEPADLANNFEAATYNMFGGILKWHEARQQTTNS